MADIDKQQMRSLIEEKLIRTGEKDKLKEYLRLRLVECGWRDDLKAYCKEIVRSKGADNVTVDELIQDISPKARAMVPDVVKSELLARIRKFLQDDTSK